MYWYDEDKGHCVETRNGDLFCFELCNTPTNGHRIWGYDSPVWRMERVQRRVETVDDKIPYYVTND